MTTEGSIAGRAVFDDLNTSYEDAYKHNPLKRACTQHVIDLLPQGSRTLDVGCGTGVPVAQMLVDAGMHVLGTDIAPNMVAAAKARVPNAAFTVADMVAFEPEGDFDAIFIIYSHLQLAYRDVHALMYRLARALKPGGFLVVGTSPTNGENVPAEDPAWDETRTYVEGYEMLYWGAPMKHTLFTRQGNLGFLTSMGLEIVYETYDVFQPANANCTPEKQQYIVAKRVGEKILEQPKPLPKTR